VAIAIAAVTAYVLLGPGPSDRKAVRSPASNPALPASDPKAEKPSEPDGGPTAEAHANLPQADAAAGPTSVAVPPAPAAPPPVPPAPEPDRARTAAAEAALDIASRDRARAEDRATLASRRLAQAAGQAALDAVRARKLAFQVRDPSTRIAQASTRGGFVRGERDRLAAELVTLRNMPRPKAESILSKNPVARPASSDEFHFELRRNRISYIDLNQLLALTRADAQVRIRMSDRFGSISSKVGPVGSFSLAYELVPAMPNTVEELIERRNIRRFDLKGWELVPEYDNRGETYEATQNPISEFTRAVNRISPSRATITLWVYPDSFWLFRRLRNDLVERGFSVAARPLPEGLPIRGSPMGTQSAAQ
jgi:hypothetical protein